MSFMMTRLSVKNAKWLIFLVLTLSLAISSATTLPQYLFSFDTDHLWANHLMLELVSIFVSTSIVAIIFQRLDGEKSSSTNTIVFGFTTIALLDCIHALSFPGMPTLVTESSAEKSIFFWLCARSVEIAILAALAFHIRFSGNKFLWLSAAGLLSLILGYLGLTHLHWFPQTFDPAYGVTRFKSNYEYALFIGHSALAAFFLVKYRAGRNKQHLYFAGACYSMALCSLTLTAYVKPSDFSLLLGHVFKIQSAIFIYAAIYLTELKRPYQLARLAEEQTLKKDNELQTLLANLPLGIIRFDPALNFQFINPFMCKLTSIFDATLIGKNINDCFPAEFCAPLNHHLDDVLSGKLVEFQFEYTTPRHATVYLEIIMMPEQKQCSSVESILCVIVDTTERENAVRNKIAALQETEILRKALDEHAIVAFTDAHGVITSTNDKFCEISQYSREELIGNTHRLVNSGYHPPSFFRELWGTITKGRIWHGEICNKTKDGTLYWMNTTIVPFVDDQGKILQYISIRADITERKVAEHEAQRLAFYDELTALPNRRLLKEKLARTLNEHSKTDAVFHALLLIDLDNFKDINDSLGHTAGDELLKQTAFRLQQQTSSTQTAARLGGDEFVLLLTHAGKTKQSAYLNVAERAELVRAALSEPCILEGQSVSITPSIGVALFDNSEKDASELLKQADIAMYQSKAHGRNQVSFFDPELQSALNKRNEILQELAQAATRNEFLLVYQPIFDQQQRIAGAEALIRWNSDKLGMIFPDQFIPLAEQSNLILMIGRWVLHAACRQLAQWSSSPATEHWTLAVNVSARQLQQDDFVDSVKTALQTHGANPQRLKLEITESMLQANIGETIKSMQTLRELGIHFSLDDFGTGFSSLSYLTKLPIDTLKIDRSFVNNMINSPEDEAVVSTILSLAASLKLNVVAEGVETQAQFKQLDSAGCQYFQGYLLGKPVGAAQLVAA
jgi:diguanylate cyclase (GGDEF)-like protein/PAS domain S-box-containing protein